MPIDRVYRVRLRRLVLFRLGRAAVLPAAVTLLALGGCAFSDDCMPPEAVTEQQEIPGIVVPEGLDPLDPNRALDVPISTAPPRDDDADECLDRPPRLRETG